MSNHVQSDILLPKHRYALSGDQDLLLNIELKQKGSIIEDNNIANFLDVAERFDKERQISKKYRILGNFNYNSPFRHLDNSTDLDSISSIKSLFDLSSINYSDLGFRFEEYFDLVVIYPTRFELVSEIDDSITLYRVIYKEFDTKQNYNFVKCGFQNNVFNQPIFNIIPNNLVNLSSYTITINNLYNYKNNDVNIPITDLKLYIKPKHNVFNLDITLKEFDNNYNENNINIDQAVTYGFDDSTIDYSHYELTDIVNTMILANIKRNNNTISLYNDAEFLYLFRSKILFFFKLNNIELTDRNMLLTRNIVYRYIGFGYGINGVKIGNLDLSNSEIKGELIKFDKSDFSYVVEEEQEYTLPFHYDYKSDIYYGQIIKETKGVIEDFINNSSYNKTDYLKSYAITYYGVDEVNQNLYVKFKCFDNNSSDMTSQMSSYINNFVSNYNSDSNKYPNKIFLNNIINNGYLSNSDELYLTLSKNNNINNLNELIIKYSYNPFINIPVRVYNSILDSSIDITETSEYAYFYNGLWIWRDVLDNGQIEPITGNGLDYPFINDTHYIDDNYILNIMVDNTDYYSNKIYSIFKSNEIGIIGYDKPNSTNGNQGGNC